MMFWRLSCIFLWLPSACCLVFKIYVGQLYYMVGNHSLSLIWICIIKFLKDFWSSLHLRIALALIVYKKDSFCFSSYPKYRFFPILFLRFLKTVATVLLGKKVRHRCAAHVFSFFTIFFCSTLVSILWFVVVVYISISKTDSFIYFPILTRCHLMPWERASYSSFLSYIFPGQFICLVLRFLFFSTWPILHLLVFWWMRAFVLEFIYSLVIRVLSFGWCYYILFQQQNRKLQHNDSKKINIYTVNFQKQVVPEIIFISKLSNNILKNVLKKNLV